MKTKFLIILASISISGCATYGPSVPDNYSGPTALIKDSVMPYSVRKADFFYLDAIDGKPVRNSAAATRIANSGRGTESMVPTMVENKIPLQASVFKITGRSEYAAPIQAMLNPVYTISGTVSFTPEKDKVYIVKGDLDEGYSAVWLEEEASHRMIGEKIELRTPVPSNAVELKRQSKIPFPGGPTNFVAANSFPYQLAIDLPSDLRQNYANSTFAGTTWSGCKYDTVWGKAAPKAIQQRLLSELSAAKLFKDVSTTENATSEFHLKTEIDAFCGDTKKVAILVYRAAGITSINFTLERKGKIIWQGKIDKVITDEDAEYSGSQFSTHDSAITHVMADSLRVVLKELLPQLESAAKAGG